MSESSLVHRVWVDGACSGNPGPGGWAALIVMPLGEVVELGGFEGRTTNNRMELMAAISALRALSRYPGQVRVKSDSEYVVIGITKWLPGWRRRGWMRKDKQPVANQDLWQTLDALVQLRTNLHRVYWEHVDGHSGDLGNERADALAVSYSKGRPLPLYHGGLTGYKELLRRNLGQPKFLKVA